MIHQRIILIGYRATGKTSTAAALARQLGWQWFDSDAELAAQDGRDIASIFAEDGEPAFRRREAEVLRKLCLQPRAVIATGGGAVLSKNNRILLKAAGTVFWLTANATVIRQRLSSDPETSRNRPALAGTDPSSEVESVLAARLPYYEECADHVIATDEQTPHEVAEQILEQLREEG